MISLAFLSREQIDLLRRQTNNLPAMLMLYGHALGLSGDKAAARGVLKQLENASQTRYVPAIYFAGVYTGLGDFDQAFQWLDKAYEERDDRLIYLHAELPTFQRANETNRVGLSPFWSIGWLVQTAKISWYIQPKRPHQTTSRTTTKGVISPQSS